jgi:hypothetical protein
VDQGEGAKKEVRMCAEFIDIASRGATADQSCLDSSSIESVLEVCHIVLLPELEAATTTSPILVPRSGVFLHRSMFPLPSLVPVRSLRRSCIYSYGLAFKVA